MKRVFFRDAPYSRPHSLEWWKEYMERFNTGEYVHQVKLGNEVQYKLVMIWLVNHWMHEQDLPAVDALKCCMVVQNLMERNLNWKRV